MFMPGFNPFVEMGMGINMGFNMNMGINMGMGNMNMLGNTQSSITGNPQNYLYMQPYTNFQGIYPTIQTCKPTLINLESG